MLEIINAIPDSVGWALVGATGMLCVVMWVKVIKILVQMYKDWKEDRNETEICEA